MPGVDPEVSVYRLYVDPHYKPINQKKRSFSEEKVPNPNGRWRMCTDFTNINKAYPKDCYPLPNIDRLVDPCTGYKVVDFLDAFQGYHQIFMAEQNLEKTVFVTE
ncbi:hypothetical protein LIER_21251 [Lithospermum erythrorhizon]|uniref:Reverse transcriptase n=1 Tax=Lithospermum erythrorhizon TaxID=34254 RepID=A0AAV3QVB2_LITER